MMRRITGWLAACMLACSVSAAAFAAADGTRLELPQGVDLAVVAFEDLQCPDCARAHPVLLEQTRTAGVPLIIRDFPITRHVWAFPAAVLARYFSNLSPELGVEFRSYVYEHQREITPANLREHGERFAAAQRLTLPGDVDPDGKLAALVQADYDLGIRIGLEYVPLMFVVARGDGASRAVEVKDAGEVGPAVAKFRQGAQPQR